MSDDLVEEPMDYTPIGRREITDVMVDRAIRAWNDWPVDHPITAQWKLDSSWIAMRRALAAALGVEA